MARTRDPALAARRRQQVLDATVSLLETGSWRGTSLAAVARQAGVSKGVVTYWFPDKQALILAAIAHYHARYEDQLTALAHGPGDARRTLVAMIEVAFPSVEAVAAEVAFQAEVLSFAKEHPEARALVRDAYRTFHGATQLLIAVGVAEGYVVDPDPELHRYVHALIDGLSFQVAADPSVDLPALRAGLLTQLERWFAG